MPTLMPGSCSVTGVMVSHRKPPSSDFLRWFLSSVCPLRFPLTTACSHKHVTPWPFCAKSWQLPALLPAGGVTTPAVGIKLVVFIAESWLEGATMQIQLDHIGDGESLRWQVGEEEFVDCTRPRHANGTLLLARRMSCDHHAAAAALWSHWDVGAIVEAARHLTFRATLLSIRRQMQPGLDAWVIQYGVVLAPRHKRVACQIREDRFRAIGSIQAQQRTLRGELVCSKVGADGLDPLAQFLAIHPVPFVAEAAEPLMTVGLQDGGAGTYHLASLTSGVARGTHRSQATLRPWQMVSAGQGTLAGRLTRAVDVEDLPLLPLPIPESRDLGVCTQRSGQHIGQKQRAQGFDHWHRQGRQSTRESRAGGQPVSPKERHEGLGPGPQGLVESLQGALPTDGVAKENDKKVDQFIVSKASSLKADAFGELGQDALLPKMLRQEHEFAPPGRRTGQRVSRCLDHHRSVGDTVHMLLLDGKTLILPHQGGIFFGWLATCQLVALLVGLASTSPGRCDDCPNCPARSRLNLLPTHDADGAGRAPGIGLPRSATGERRLCLWWVPPPHRARARSNRLVPSREDVPPTDTSASAAS